ncbi:cytochrome b/b6 domain-containing protein [Candidatus Poseidonia alphae]|nr:cytochrome b/b6 domain-containing protein [Candidatus Poseidonia alphae]MDA8638791.1 cytochrome b/b6 domain-containing protein [Candidatus Poseidonia alphae]MDA8748964.1 cytochrome b/b6 domain-containing protein [Candidatus Poseidonia alphae]MDB2637326.1 cytochrome b/b6 domain-containing protein [Candidatus Poseidonia alphae]
MQTSHTLFAKSIHWSFIVLYLYGLSKQIGELDELEDNGLLLFEILFATVFLVVVILRYSYMRRFKTFLGAREPIHIVHYYFARSLHKAMYVVFILLPLSGLLIAGLYTKGYQNEDELLMEAALGLHSLAAQASILLILAHIAAAIYSRIKGEGVWSSMVPILKEDKPSDNETVKKIAAAEEQFYNKVESLFTRANK